MIMEKYLFTSESVTEGHPDKICDKISDAILDEMLRQDPMSRVACETFATTGIITVMGEVTRPGQYDFVRDEITILDALALAGDMTIYGERDTVAVIRKIDGKSVVCYLNLLSKDAIASPFYHLQPNDVVYVKPNRYKAANAEINQNRSFWISIVSTLVSVATLATTIVLNAR